MPTSSPVFAQARRSARARARKLAKAQAAVAKAANVFRQRFDAHDPRGPRVELTVSAQQEETPEVPTLTLPLSPEFTGPQLIIHRPEDIDRFVQTFCGEPHRPGIPYRYFCIRHNFREERTLTLVEALGHAPLVHCSRCGLRLSVLEFLQDLYPDQETFFNVARRVWPNKVRSGEIDLDEFRRLEVHRRRRIVLEVGRFHYFSSVNDNELRPSFGDWTMVTFDALKWLLARESIPVEMPPDFCLLNVLRTHTGEIVALDVYKDDYEPLFRSWLSVEASVTRPELFLVPTWCDYCDRARERLLCTRHNDAHELERQAVVTPVASRQPIWLRCPSQPLAPVLRAPSYVPA